LASGLREIRPERIIETWVFRLLSDGDRGYLLLETYSRGRAERGRIKAKQHVSYTRNGKSSNIALEDVPLPDEVEGEARKLLLERIIVSKQI
jgi:hypothetical protein